MTSLRLTLICALGPILCFSQNAQVSGSIRDPSSLTMSGADVLILNEETGGRRNTRSNESGFYSLPSLAPGTYRITVRAPGFEAIVREGIKLEVGDTARLDFDLRIGDSRTVVTVYGGPPLMNTDDASVGTVIDREIIDQMPLNGRGIQTLIELSPGVVATPVLTASPGQFVVNGQRNDASYFTVDGVSANFAALGSTLSLLPTGLQTGSPAIPANNFLGTFSNLVSPDALQEFRIQTSTFAPEFGHSPGAQIGMITRSGANRYTGSLFEYLRNDRMDASDWFANAYATGKPPLRFNNFGGTLGGPLRIPHLYNGHDRTFFFASVESLLAVEPQPSTAIPVPTLAARQNAPPAAAALLNAWPLPNRSYGPDGDPSVSGIGEYVSSFSLRQGQQTYALRLDQIISDRLMLFTRYSRAPAASPSPPETLGNSPIYNTIATQTLTVGLTHILTPHLVNEIHWNGSAQTAASVASFNNATGGVQTPASLLFPPGYSPANSYSLIGTAAFGPLNFGFLQINRSRQLEAVDNLSYSIGAHQLKLGADYRWFSPEQTEPRLLSLLFFGGLYGASGISSAVASEAILTYDESPDTAFVNKVFSAYLQDTWRANRRLTITYGLRWEVNPSPQVSAGQATIGMAGPNPSNISGATLVPSGRPFYPTSWSNFAPRLGIAWQIMDDPKRKTVLRVGAGQFFDLGQSGLEGNIFNAPVTLAYANQPLGSFTGGTPLLETAPPNSLSSANTVEALLVSRSYKLPYTWEWNATLEQSIGQQTFSIGYLGALGRRLVGWTGIFAEQSQFLTLNNDASSSYHALQLQFNRRLSARLHLLLSYTWSHSIDDLSNDEPYFTTNVSYAQVDPRAWGSSDFDVRQSLNGSVIAALPASHNGIAGALFRNWTANSIFFARSALPTDLYVSPYVRPDVVPGEPLYLYGSEYPGGKSFNPAAFAPPAGARGDLGRNVVRGLGAWQIDFALHREFPLSERVNLQLRAEAFNVLNHPNFANPSDPENPGVLTVGAARVDPLTSNTTLANGLGPNGVVGQLSPLFQIGGPRTMQLALRVHF
jgi:hypothetical protein